MGIEPATITFMNKYLAVGVAVVLIIAGGWWYINRSSESAVTDTTQLPTTQSTEDLSPKTTTFSVYFGKENDPSDPSSILCAHAVTRTVPYTTGVAQAALAELFKGPTASEKQQGYYGCFFQTDIAVKSVQIENGVATVDVSRQYTEGCGGASACSQSSRNAVRNTLTQFPSIESVRILIEGVPEGNDA